MNLKVLHVEICLISFKPDDFLLVFVSQGMLSTHSCYLLEIDEIEFIIVLYLKFLHIDLDFQGLGSASVLNFNWDDELVFLIDEHFCVVD